VFPSLGRGKFCSKARSASSWMNLLCEESERTSVYQDGLDSGEKNAREIEETTSSLFNVFHPGKQGATCGVGVSGG
jgi:hypothetical protein